jgi:hypothetical protein
MTSEKPEEACVADCIEAMDINRDSLVGIVTG